MMQIPLPYPFSPGSFYYNKGNDLMGLWEGYNERITGLYFICSTGADTPHQIAKLAQALETPNCRIITPNLGWLRTFWRIEPLIQTVETLVAENRATYPTTPMRIIGHSMGD